MNDKGLHSRESSTRQLRHQVARETHREVEPEIVDLGAQVAQQHGLGHGGVRQSAFGEFGVKVSGPSVVVDWLPGLPSGTVRPCGSLRKYS